jgi:carboxyl-terminal processing protease
MRKSALVVALVVLLAPATGLAQAKSGKSGVYEQLNLFGEAFERIRHDAVEPVGDTRLIETAINGMLAGLDPHSAYLNDTEYKALQARNTAPGGTTGLVVTLDNGQVKVVAPRDGSPAAKADIKPGDVIFSIDKEPIYDLTLTEVEQKLLGAPDSEVTLMLRRGTGSPTEAKLKRTGAKFPTVNARLESGDIGYIRLVGFDEATQSALTEAVRNLRQQAGNKLVGFIIDLRNNPGGSFDAAVAAADAFIDKGDITVVKSRKAEGTRRIAATPGDVANGQPIVALVNGGTAREAELVAGALQDSHRAVLLGTKTFGESGIESVIPLPGSGAIRLTTARYVTPSGRAIQGKGLDPDLTVSPLKLEKLAQADHRREADLRGALKNPDSQPKGATPGGGDKTAPSGDKTAPGGDKQPAAGATPSKSDQPNVAAGDIGTTSDEQLSQAVDVLRGLALLSGRTAQR